MAGSMVVGKVVAGMYASALIVVHMVAGTYVVEVELVNFLVDAASFLWVLVNACMVVGSDHAVLLMPQAHHISLQIFLLPRHHPKCPFG